jgi:hypothetical protein
MPRVAFSQCTIEGSDAPFRIEGGSRITGGDHAAHATGVRYGIFRLSSSKKLI